MRKTGATNLLESVSPGRRFVAVLLRIGLLLLVLASLVFLFGERRSEWGWAYPGSLLERQRYGFVALSANWRQAFDVEQLGAGWYVDANPPACATSPSGMDRAILIRVRDWLTSPRVDWLESMVDAHPGALWLVGNEPDCIWQDNLQPEDYADIYHEIYWTIKDRDPTALVSPGGIVQPTPLRLQWLDRVLGWYQSQYNTLMPVDVWNIHNQILQEVRDDWGADIPPGFDGLNEGVLYDVQDNDNIEIFEQQLWDFREWMSANGYGGWPLIVSEFGVLMPVVAGFDLARVNAFMDATFEFLATATSDAPETLGDPADGHRLVQRWAWFSLDNPPYDPSSPEPQTFNGNLFDPDTTAITGYGLNYATHTGAFPTPEYVDLSPGELVYEPLGPVEPGELVNRTVEVEVQNLGSLPAGPFVVKLTYDDNQGGSLQHTVNGLAAGSSDWLEFELTGLSVGAYTVLVSVDPEDEVSETTECDNELASIMVIPSDAVYLPLVLRRH